MAAPHVAGAVALLWSARPELKNQITLTEQLIGDSAVPLWSTACSSAGWPNNTFGYGRLDIQAALYGVALSDVSSQSGDRGSIVTYTLRFTNTGITSDSFTVTLDPGQWQSTLAFASTGLLTANESMSVTATHWFRRAMAYTRLFTVTVASQTKPQRTDSYCHDWRHCGARHALSPSLRNIAMPGSWVTYTLRLTNTGNVTQSYALGLIGNRLAMLKPYSTTLPAGQEQEVLVSVFLPPFLLENATTYVLAWYDTFTGTLASYAQLEALVAVHPLYLPLVLQ
jgi:hypothetical protein